MNKVKPNPNFKEINHCSYEIYRNEKRVNNRIIEKRNKTIKTIKHNSNRYRNWERFRNRIIYGILKEGLDSCI